MVPSLLWHCWLGDRKGIRPVKKQWWGAGMASVWSEVQTCIWPSWCHCHSLSPASVKSRLVLPFWYWLTQVVLEKGPLNGCVCVCVCVVTNGQCKATPSVTYSDVISNHCPLIGTKLYSLMTQAHVCEQLVQDCYWEWYGHGVKLMIFKSQMQCPNYYNIRHNPERNFYSLVSIFNNDHPMNYHSNTGYYQSH